MSRIRYPHRLTPPAGSQRVPSHVVVDRIRERWPDFDGVAINCPTHGRVELQNRAAFAGTRHMNCPSCEAERCAPPDHAALVARLAEIHPKLQWPAPTFTRNHGRVRMITARCPVHAIEWDTVLKTHLEGKGQCPKCNAAPGRKPSFRASP